MISLSAMMLAVQAPLSSPPVVTYTQARPTDAEFCEEMRRVSAARLPDVPVMAGPTTRVDGFSVLCGDRSVSWEKFILMDMASLREGWRERKQAEFNRLICDHPTGGVMARRGWRFAQDLTFQSGERVTLVAECDSSDAVR